MKTFANLFKIWLGDRKTPDSIRGSVWAKKVTSVDENKTNGYAFKGDFLEFTEERMTINDINVNDIIIMSVDEGSAKYHCPNVKVIRVTAVDKHNIQYELLAHIEGYDWARQLLADDKFMQKVKEILREDKGEKTREEVILEVYMNSVQRRAKMLLEEIERLEEESEFQEALEKSKEFLSILAER